MPYNQSPITGSHDPTYIRKKGRRDIMMRPEDYRKFLEMIKTKPANEKLMPRDHCAFVCMINMGLRIAEVAELKRQHFNDLDYDPPMANVPAKKKNRKGGKKADPFKVLFVHPKIAEYLIRYMDTEMYENQKFLFPGGADGHISTRHLRRMFYHYAGLCKFKANFTPHSARHGWGTLLYEWTGNQVFVRDQMGHAVTDRSMATTNIYMHLSPVKAKECLKKIEYFI